MFIPLVIAVLLVLCVCFVCCVTSYPTLTFRPFGIPPFDLLTPCLLSRSLCDLWFCFSFIFDRHTFSSGTNHLWNFIWTYLSYIPSFVHLLLSLSISFSCVYLLSFFYLVSSHPVLGSLVVNFSFLSSFFLLHAIITSDIQSRQTKPISHPRRHVYIHLLSHKYKYKYITRLHLAS